MKETDFYCKRCEKHLYELEKFSPWSYTAGYGTVSETLTLQAQPKIKFMKEIDKGTLIRPKILICKCCGSVEYVISKNNLGKIIEIEDDIRY